MATNIVAICAPCSEEILVRVVTTRQSVCSSLPAGEILLIESRRGKVSASKHSVITELVLCDLTHINYPSRQPVLF